jgi:hypothetical protein
MKGLGFIGLGRDGGANRVLMGGEGKKTRNGKEGGGAALVTYAAARLAGWLACLYRAARRWTEEASDARGEED